ncbi:MAG: hypothetical protein AAGI30_10170 [Planctomycetota bacterium]
MVSAAGDVNTDGIDDLIIGARDTDPSGRRPLVTRHHRQVIDVLDDGVSEAFYSVGCPSE